MSAQLKFILEPIKYGLGSDDPELFSQHYIKTVLQNSKQYQELNINEQIDAIESLYRKLPLGYFKNVKEDVVEKELLIPLFDILKIKWRSQPSIQGNEIDYAFYEGVEFAKDFSNSTAVCESKRQGILHRHYYIKKRDNSDPIYQTLQYLKDVNTQRVNAGSKAVQFGLLTDGSLFRIYSAAYTHDPKQFESNFIEFNIDDIMAHTDDVVRRDLLKTLIYFLDAGAWSSRLHEIRNQAVNYGAAVSTELKAQLYSALELISTGLWRKATENYNEYLQHVFSSHYNIDISVVEQNEDERNRTLKVIFDESLVLLLRLLFILYAEDRDLFDKKLIKAQDGILERIRQAGHSIGAIPANLGQFKSNDDVAFADHCRRIDEKYNGGLFSTKDHPLLAEFNIDDTLFANAVDLLCRVKVGKDIVTVDFSALGVRELGTIYEGLLEYKLEVATEYIRELPTLLDKNKKRRDIEVGDVYLINHKGERKSTGSYYTPDEMVTYLVKQTLGRKLDAILKSGLKPKETIEAILSLKIIDPAMGSGHFLLEAFGMLVQSIAKLNEEHELELQYADIKALVARRCIYGVDLNNVAVEIAKMVLWLKVFRTDKPFEFFDYNLQTGNSLIGIYDDSLEKIDTNQMDLFDSIDKIEASNVVELTVRVEKLLMMPRETIAEIHAVEDYYQKEVRLWQKTITFFYNLKLVEHLEPQQWKIVSGMREDILRQIQKDPHFVVKLFSKNSTIKAEYKALGKIAKYIEDTYDPFHWRVEFPHVFQQGGFDIVLGNPPWDIIKPDHNKFFSDYIEGYSQLETKVAKQKSQELIDINKQIYILHEKYQKAIVSQNNFFANAYSWQVVHDSAGNKLSGDNNLYKVFIEKAYTILRSGGECGFVVPSGLNTDQGCSGLRRLLFEQANVRELIMFDNKRAIFPAVHRQYKFETIIFEKAKPKRSGFTAGFYWQDARWLNAPVVVGDKKIDNSEFKIHERYSYPTKISKLLSPTMGALIEMRSAKDIAIVEKIAQHPLLGDSSQKWHIRTYREFDMTLDAKLFNTHGEGYPLYEGKMMHQYDAYFEQPTRFVDSALGEERLSQKWKTPHSQLPDRQFRIAFRSIGRSTDSRTLIATMLPRFVFVGNSLNLIDVGINNVQKIGLLSILNSLTLDYLIRARVSSNVNAFYVKELPVPKDLPSLEELGRLATALIYGREFDDLRGEVLPLEKHQEEERSKLRAKIDARVAHMYDLTYEQLQHILSRFLLVSEEYKKEVLYQYKQS